MPWIAAFAVDEVEAEDAIRFDYGGRTYAVCADEGGAVHCLDGLCPYDGAHLAGGLVGGMLIECPAEGCLFDIRDGAVKGGPARGPVAVHPVRVFAGCIEIDLPDRDMENLSSP